MSTVHFIVALVIIRHIQLLLSILYFNNMFSITYVTMLCVLWGTNEQHKLTQWRHIAQE